MTGPRRCRAEVAVSSRSGTRPAGRSSRAGVRYAVAMLHARRGRDDTLGVYDEDERPQP